MSDLRILEERLRDARSRQVGISEEIFDIETEIRELRQRSLDDVRLKFNGKTFRKVIRDCYVSFIFVGNVREFVSMDNSTAYYIADGLTVTFYNNQHVHIEYLFRFADGEFSNMVEISHDEFKKQVDGLVNDLSKKFKNN